MILPADSTSIPKECFCMVRIVPLLIQRTYSSWTEQDTWKWLFLVNLMMAFLIFRK